MALPEKNDVMRSGPRGSSDQAAFAGPYTEAFTFTRGAIVGTLSFSVPLRFGTAARVRDIEIAVLEVIAASSTNPTFTVGKTGDTDAFMTATATPTTTAAGTIVAATKANEASWGTDAYLIDSDTDLIFDQTIAGAGGSVTGVVQIRVLLEPVSGTYLNNS